MPLAFGKQGGVYDVSIIAGAAVTVSRIAETTTWSISITREFGEIRKHGAEWMRRLGGIRDFSGSFEAILAMDTNQSLFTNRLTDSAAKGTVVFAFYQDGNNASGSATLPRIQGTAWISGIDSSSPSAELQTYTCNFLGQGTVEYLA